MKMKKVMGLFLVAVMVAGLTACGGGNDKAAQADGGGKEEADSGKKTITFCFRDDGQGEDGALWKWIQDGYDTWDKKDTVELNIAPIVAQEGDYFTKVALQLADKKTCPDLVCEDTFQLPNDVSAGYLTKLDDYVKDYEDWNTSYYDSMKKGVTGSDGSVYGIPYCTDTRGLWYNRDILAQAGVISEGQDWEPKAGMIFWMPARL